MSAVALDTNILVYFLDQTSPFHHAANRAITALEANQDELFVCDQNMLELMRVLQRFYSHSVAQALSKVHQLEETNITIVSPNASTRSCFYELCQTRPEHHYDLYLAATLLTNHITTIVTNDLAGFRDIEQLEVLDLNYFRSYSA